MIDPQTPAEDEPPLEVIGDEAVDELVVDARDSAEIADDILLTEDQLDGEDEEEEEAGTDQPLAAAEVLDPTDILRGLQQRNTNQGNAAIVTGDDAFDVEPVFGSRAGRLAGARSRLPIVELPQIEGQGSAPGAVAGASGVVAIFCEEQFSDPNKIAECAGRVQILSGWRPGDSGEDYSRAVELIREAQRRGRGNQPDYVPGTGRFSGTGEGVVDDPLFGPIDNTFLDTFARRNRNNNLDKADNARADNGINRGLAEVGDPLATSVNAAENGIDIGPGPLGRTAVEPPSETIRDVRKFEREQRRLEELRREAERENRKNGDGQ